MKQLSEFSPLPVKSCGCTQGPAFCTLGLTQLGRLYAVVVGAAVGFKKGEILVTQQDAGVYFRDYAEAEDSAARKLRNGGRAEMRNV